MQLARTAGWHRTKVSKLEAAATAPSVEDIRAWCAACGVPELAAELIQDRHAADSLWLDWRRMERAGLRAAQASVRELYTKTRLLRAYSPTIVPGPVQSGPYIRHILDTIRVRRGVPIDDVDAAVAERVDRQETVLAGPGRTVVIVEEAALRMKLGGREVMAGQLEHLLNAARLPTLSLGVIPMDADRSNYWPVEGFHLFDDEQVAVELVSGFLTITQPREIEMYAAGFEELADAALFDAAAAARIGAALASLD